MQDNGGETFSDWEEEEDKPVIYGLLSSKLFNSLEEMMSDEQITYNTDWKAIITKYDLLDDISLIMLVNYVRFEVKKLGSISSDGVHQILNGIESKDFLKNDAFMTPTLPDDQLLYLLADYLNSDDNENEDNWQTTVQKHNFLAQVSAVDKNQVSDVRQAELTKVLEDDDDESLSPDIDTSYFSGYSNLSIHETMLRDYPRTHAYEMAIMNNSLMFQNKVVLDVGCGTGILSMFAARAGAKLVIGVDCSEIITKTKKIITQNGFGEVIVLLKGKLEDLELPVEEGQVDIIVSEWMGYGLYFEDMLASVIYARNKYLKSESEGGLMLPSSATLFIEGLTGHGGDDRVSYWENVHGFDMSEFMPDFTKDAQIQDVSSDDIVTNRCDMHRLDISTALNEDLDFICHFEVVSYCSMHAIVLCFCHSFFHAFIC